MNRSATRFELSRRVEIARTCYVEIARTCSNLVADWFEAKFHYAILVADRSEAGRRPVVDLLARARSLLVIGQIPESRSLQVCHQDSVMEFGFNLASYGPYARNAVRTGVRVNVASVFSEFDTTATRVSVVL